MVSWKDLQSLFDGAQSTVANVLIINSVKEEQLAPAFGIWLFFLSITMVSGPPLAGKYNCHYKKNG